jgi:hypothetical protein
MFTKVFKFFYVKPIAHLLILSVLCMSFSIRKPLDVILPAGTSVPMETTAALRSEELLVGQVVDFRVKADIKVGDKVVIAAGSIAKGQVIRAQRAKGIGKEGYLEIQIKSVTAADGQEVFLSNSNLYQEGENKQTLSIVLGVLVCILFLTMKGKNAVIPPGYQVMASVASNTTVKI